MYFTKNMKIMQLPEIVNLENAITQYCNDLLNLRCVIRFVSIVNFNVKNILF